MAHGHGCFAVCGIFPDQGWNPCPLHWQADSLPLSHHGSSPLILIKDEFFTLYKVKGCLAPAHLSYLVLFHIPPSTPPQLCLSICLSVSLLHTHTHTHTPCSLPGSCTGLFLRHLLPPPLHLLFPGKPFLTSFYLLSPTLPWVSISLSLSWGTLA